MLCLGLSMPLPAQKMQVYTTLKTGISSVNASSLRTWALREGASNVVGRADNMMLVWDFGAVLNRVFFDMSLDYDLGSRRFAKPHTSLFHLGSGYVLKKSNQLDLILAGNVGVGNLRIRFREQIPQSLRIHHISDDCFARLIMLTGQPSLVLNLKPQFKKQKYNSRSDMMGVILSAKIGANIPLITGHWRYGLMQESNNASTNNVSATFIGQRVDIPKFYKMGVFIQIGVGFVMEGY